MTPRKKLKLKWERQTVLLGINELLYEKKKQFIKKNNLEEEKINETYGLSNQTPSLLIFTRMPFFMCLYHAPKNVIFRYSRKIPAARFNTAVIKLSFFGRPIILGRSSAWNFQKTSPVSHVERPRRFGPVQGPSQNRAKSSPENGDERTIIDENWQFSSGSNRAGLKLAQNCTF